MREIFFFFTASKNLLKEEPIFTGSSGNSVSKIRLKEGSILDNFLKKAMQDSKRALTAGSRFENYFVVTFF